MPADVPELLTGGPPERYGHDREPVGLLRPSASRPLHAVAGLVAGFAVVTAVVATSSGGRAHAPPAPAAVQEPAPPISPALLAALRASRARTLGGQTGIIGVHDPRPSAATARAAAWSLLSRTCISPATADIRLANPDRDWLDVEVSGDAPQTRPFSFRLTWAGSGYGYRFPQIPDACP